jgi:hypothetical protein
MMRIVQTLRALCDAMITIAGHTENTATVQTIKATTYTLTAVGVERGY